MISLLPKILYDYDGDKYYLHIWTERRFMFPDKRVYVFAYKTEDDCFATKIEHRSLFILCLEALKWVYGGCAKSWGITVRKPKK